MLMEPVQKKKETPQPDPKRPESSVSTLPARAEALSGLSMDDVRIHYNSSAPKAFGALAYTSGSEIHLGPSQEHCLGHELGHVVQQKQGLVRPQFRINGLPANEEPALERDADRFSACLQRMRDTGLSGVRGASMPRRGPVQMLRKLVQTGLDKGDVYYDKKDGKYYNHMEETTEPVLDAAYSAAHPPVEAPAEKPPAPGGGSRPPVSAEEPAPAESVEAPAESVEAPAKKRRKRNPRRKRRQSETPPAPGVGSRPPVSEEEPARPVLTNQDVLDFLNEPDEIKARVQLAGNKITCKPAPVPVPFRKKTKGGLNRILLQTERGFFMPDVENPRLLTSGTPLRDDAVYSIRLYAEGEFSHAIGLSEGLAKGRGLPNPVKGMHLFHPRDAVVKATEFRSADKVNKAYTPGRRPPESTASAIISNKTAETKNLEYSFGGTTGDMTHPSKEPTPDQMRRQYDRIQSTFFWIPKTDMDEVKQAWQNAKDEKAEIFAEIDELRKETDRLVQEQKNIKKLQSVCIAALQKERAKRPQSEAIRDEIFRLSRELDKLNIAWPQNSQSIVRIRALISFRRKKAEDISRQQDSIREFEKKRNKEMFERFMAAKLPKLKDNGILCIVVTNKKPYNEVLDNICENPPPGYENGHKNLTSTKRADGTYRHVTYAQILEGSGHNDSGDFQHTQTVELKEVSAPKGDLFYTFRKKSPEGTPHAVPPRKPGDASIPPSAARSRPRNK